MVKAVRLARCTIAVLSPDYFSSQFTQPEWVVAFRYDPKSEKGRVLPVQKCDVEGLALPEGEATHCSFSGPIQLEVVRWLESTVEVVQCPRCDSVSKAKVKGQSVVFAPHPPRKVRAMRNITRWMELGTQWVLVQKKE